MKKVFALFLILVSMTAFGSESTKQAKLEQLVNLMDMDSMVDSMYSQMEGMMQNMYSQMGIRPSEQAIFDKYYEKMMTMLREEFSWAKMEPEIIEIYGRNFSEQEIDDMLAFYQTETGQALIHKMPVVMQESMQMSQSMMQGSMPKIQELARQLGEDIAASRRAQ